MEVDKKIADATDIQRAQTYKVLDQIIEQIRSLSTKLGCDMSKITHMLGGEGKEINKRNLILYLGALEHRIDQLLSVKSYTTMKVRYATDAGCV